MSTPQSLKQIFWIPSLALLAFSMPAHAGVAGVASKVVKLEEAGAAVGKAVESLVPASKISKEMVTLGHAKRYILLPPERVDQFLKHADPSLIPMPSKQFFLLKVPATANEIRLIKDPARLAAVKNSVAVDLHLSGAGASSGSNDQLNAAISVEFIHQWQQAHAYGGQFDEWFMYSAANFLRDQEYARGAKTGLKLPFDDLEPEEVKHYTDIIDTAMKRYNEAKKAETAFNLSAQGVAAKAAAERAAEIEQVRQMQEQMRALKTPSQWGSYTKDGVPAAPPAPKPVDDVGTSATIVREKKLPASSNSSPGDSMPGTRARGMP